jgi:hypothetical protein
MAWCHACEEKKRTIERKITGKFIFNNKKDSFKKFVEGQRRQTAAFSFRIGRKK